MELDTNADYVTMTSLAVKLVDKINDYQDELRNIDENDSLYDYVQGLVSAYQSVAMMIGVPDNLYEIEEV
jgi:hypothetical protein